MGFFAIIKNRVMVVHGCELSSMLLNLLDLYMETFAAQNKVRLTGRKSRRVTHTATMDSSSYKAIHGGLIDLQWATHYH